MLPIIVAIAVLVFVGFFGYLAYCDLKMQKMNKEKADDNKKIKK